MIIREQFEKIIAQEFPNAIPGQFQPIIKNVAFLVAEEPDEETRREEGLQQNETLLGLYRGVPATARGDLYGVGAVLPDSITLYQLPIEEEAAFLCKGDASQFEACVRRVVRETVWHEVAHHFGFGEGDVRRKERERKNAENRPR